MQWELNSRALNTFIGVEWDCPGFWSTQDRSKMLIQDVKVRRRCYYLGGNCLRKPLRQGWCIRCSHYCLAGIMQRFSHFFIKLPRLVQPQTTIYTHILGVTDEVFHQKFMQMFRNWHKKDFLNRFEGLKIYCVTLQNQIKQLYQLRGNCWPPAYLLFNVWERTSFRLWAHRFRNTWGIVFGTSRHFEAA